MKIWQVDVQKNEQGLQATQENYTQNSSKKIFKKHKT